MSRPSLRFSPLPRAMRHQLVSLYLNPDQILNLIEQTEGQHLSATVSYTTKAKAHPPTRLLQYSRTNNDIPIPPRSLHSETQSLRLTLLDYRIWEVNNT